MPDRNVWLRGPVWTRSDKPIARYVARPLREFLRIEGVSSAVLLVAAVAALVWANVAASGYADFWHAHVGLDVGGFHLSGSLQHWVDDGLMVVFFFVVGLEIKYELVSGDLRDPRTAALPIVGAIGGMVVPALIYVAIAGGAGSADAARGWGIPMATDIAFAVGLLGLLGRRIPSPARLFLLTLAIVDDIGAIVVIAVFYTSDLDLAWLATAVGLLGVVVLMRAVRVWAFPAYLAVGLVVWYALLQSGVHATLAGVALGLLTPARPLLKEDVAREFAQEALADRQLDPDEVHRLRFLLAESVPIVDRLQHHLHPLSAYVVLPVFALANAGVDLGGGIGDALTSPVALGVAVGLVVGKPVGILLACLIASRVGLARLPRGTSWPQLAGLGAVAGIGFTVSLFIADLSFPGSAALTDEAKVGILAASVVAALVGALVLIRAQPTGSNEESSASSAS